MHFYLKTVFAWVAEEAERPKHLIRPNGLRHKPLRQSGSTPSLTVWNQQEKEQNARIWNI